MVCLTSAEMWQNGFMISTISRSAIPVPPSLTRSAPNRASFMSLKDPVGRTEPLLNCAFRTGTITKKPGRTWASGWRVTWNEIVLKTLCLILLFAAAVTVRAQDPVAADDGDPKQQTTEQEKSADDSAATQKEPEPATPDSFNPTEKIDEDHSIAFPTDI